ncbi:carbohydrate ABC transporter permease [Tessaracoccus oleiagri]|uniref:Multiple sugar transport system permease protein n=1 Tax=Tessaracoccus oleiagri TaxID=686624 RepID=A0A1G9HMI0_9ACTN|nr:carbohydrate ABC transporter permease [Tessaracoccus oleiagri]SDL13996.1 multiple sugar transport system permease protein [Tessaracoccus oleiagri]
MERSRSRWWLYIVLTILFLLVITPFLWMILGSLKTQGELLQVPPTWIPENPTLDNFSRLFDRLSFGRYFFNSTVVALVVTISNLLFCSMLGYALAHLNFPGKRIIFGAVLGTLMIPGLVTFIPQFVLVVNLGLANTLPALFLPFLVAPFGVFLMRQFFLGMPRDMLEAGRIDGAGELGIFFRLFLPLAGPALATLGILTFLASWNNFLWPLVVASTERTYTLPVALALVSTGQNQTDYGLLLAGASVVVLPIILVFLFFQRYFIEGIATTGIK